jgi:hypothetical protein
LFLHIHREAAGGWIFVSLIMKKLSISPAVAALLESLGGAEWLKHNAKQASSGYTINQFFFTPVGSQGTVWLTAIDNAVLVEYRLFVLSSREYEVVDSFRCCQGQLKENIESRILH